MAVVNAACKHCLTTRYQIKARGICNSCYRDPETRLRYPGRPQNRLPPDTNRLGPLPDSSTDAIPGTKRKMAVLAHRAAGGQQLHHPDDQGYGAVDYAGLGTLLKLTLGRERIRAILMGEV